MNKTKFLRLSLVSLFVILLVFTFLTKKSLFSNAQQIVCNTPETKAQCEKELAELEKAQAELNKLISSTQSQKATLSRDLTLLRAKIEQKKLAIKKLDGNISLLSNQISAKNVELNGLNNDLDKQKVALSKTLRNVNAFDGTNNFLNLLLDGRSISQFFETADKLIFFQEAINRDVNDIKNTTDKVSQVKAGLEDNKDTQLALKLQQQAEQRKIDVTRSQTDTLLKETKGQETLYKKQLSEKQAKAAQIRAALFSFAGGATKAIPFGDALKYAEEAEKTTGTPAALVLAILMQESALGANVGKCYLSDTSSGAGYNINTKTEYSNVMKASRDIPGFLQITSALGMDPLKTVVSCPIPSAGGYGGAMGPAQFIPSTWLGVAGRLGLSNPWNARQAIFASSQYLADLGANDSYTSQIRAACKYYGTGGSTCSYGTQVMSKVAGVQEKIDYIKQYGQ